MFEKKYFDQDFIYIFCRFYLKIEIFLSVNLGTKMILFFLTYEWSGPGFTNVLQEILSSEAPLTHRFYLILKHFRLVSSSNNIIKCISKRARCIYIRNYSLLDKICRSKYSRMMQALVLK